MKQHTIIGGGGTKLNVVETGNRQGQAILFIHGFSQCALAWNRQLASDLANTYRLVAMDMRGHGSSDRPREVYGDSKLWADDVDAVMRGLALDEPILSGWSYGPLVILDYIRHYGQHAIGGVHIVSGITRLGTDQALSVLTPEFLALVPGFFSTDVETSVQSIESLVRMCFTSDVTDAELFTILGYNFMVPPHVRQALFARTIGNDDILATIRKPVLITHGADDRIVKPSIVDEHKAAMPHAQVCVMPHAGHAPFVDDAPSFNRRLAEFCEHVAGVPA